MTTESKFGLTAADQKALDALTAKRQLGACAAVQKMVDEPIAALIADMQAAGAIITDANVQAEMSAVLNVLIHQVPKLRTALDLALAKA